jgi:hypothetical protein
MMKFRRLTSSFLPRLVEIAEGGEELDVIVTSIYVAPEEIVEDGRISHVVSILSSYLLPKL